MSIDSWLYVLIKAPIAGDRSLRHGISHLDYRWQAMSFFTKWDIENKKMLAITNGIPQPMMEAIRKRLCCQEAAVLKYDPFAFHVLVMSECFDAVNNLVWQMRDVIRALELDMAPNVGL